MCEINEFTEFTEFNLQKTDCAKNSFNIRNISSKIISDPMPNFIFTDQVNSPVSIDGIPVSK